MAFADDDKSVSDSAPIELYDFTVTGTTGYRYTSLDIDYVFASNTYLATKPIARSSAPVSATNTAQEMTIELPASTDLIKDNAFNVFPAVMSVVCTIVQPVSLQSQILWQGTVNQISIDARTARLRVPALIDDALAVVAPSVYFQAQCNHRLFDDGCSLNQAGFQYTTTVSTIADKVLTVGSIFANPDGYFKSGKIIRVSDGEQRLIKSQVSTTIEIGTAFRNLTLGDSVTIVAGCDHLAKTCRDKFFNIENYGGHPFMDEVFSIRRVTALFRTSFKAK